MKYFTHCKTIEELKKAYRDAAILHHPDHGGTVEEMQIINNDYEKTFQLLKNKHNAEAEPNKQTTETPDEFKNIIDILIRCDGLDIEVCGSWLWITGNTYANRDTLKAAGCKYSKSKKAWHWHHSDDFDIWRRGTATMSEIREKYGSSHIYYNQPQKLAEATA